MNATRWSTLVVIGALSLTLVDAARAEIPPEEAAFFTALDHLVGPLEEAASCEDVAEVVTTWLVAHGDALKVAAHRLEAVLAGMESEGEAAFVERFTARAHVLVDTHLRCAEHAPTREAFEAMDALLLAEP